MPAGLQLLTQSPTFVNALAANDFLLSIFTGSLLIQMNDTQAGNIFLASGTCMLSFTGGHFVVSGNRMGRKIALSPISHSHIQLASDAKSTSSEAVS